MSGAKHTPGPWIAGSRMVENEAIAKAEAQS